MKTLKHKGYVGSIEFDLEDMCLHGRVLYINDVISYGGDTVEELIESFKGAVDSYLAMCEQNNVRPDQPFSGTFNVRVGEDLHKRLAIRSAEVGKSLNDHVKSILEESFTRRSFPPVMARYRENVPASVIEQSHMTYMPSVVLQQSAIKQFVRAK